MKEYSAERILKDKDIQYNKLLEQWQLVREKVHSSSTSSKLSSYSILNDSVETEILFQVFGLKCFLRFKHDFEKGYLEYGVVVCDDNTGNTKRILVSTISFDRLGNLAAPYRTHAIREFGYVHFLVLSQIHEELLKASFNNGEK